MSESHEMIVQPPRTVPVPASGMVTGPQPSVIGSGELIFSNLLRENSSLPPPAQGGGGAVGAGAIVAPAAPVSARDGQFWFDNSTWRLFLRVSNMWWYIAG
jgi:hypothetical protein